MRWQLKGPGWLSAPRWKLLAALAISVSVIALCLLLGKTPERTAFVGNTDPASGYRCRFSLSSSWQVSAKNIDTSPTVIDNAFFRPASNRIYEWIDHNLLHHPSVSQPWIGLTSYTAKDPDDFRDITYQSSFHVERVAGRAGEKP